MKFSCVKENIERAISVAERFTGKNVTLPILSNVLLEVDGNTMSVMATDLEYAVQITVPGKSNGSGKVSIPAKILNSFFQSVKEEKVELEAKGENLFIHTDTRDVRINGMPVDDFPIMPKIKKTASFTCEGEDLKMGLEMTLPAISTSDFKPELRGVQCIVSPKNMKLAATDTFRLAEKTIAIGKNSNGEKFSFILPQKVSAELARSLQGAGDVSISLGESQILFETEGMQVISRLVEGSFPEYTAIVPKQFETTCFIGRDSLVQAVRSASIFSSRIQEVSLQFGGGNLTIKSGNTEIGENKTIIPVSFTGKDTAISFNYRYLLDGLAALDEEIFFGVNGEQLPSLLKNKSDGTFFYVLMPIRVS